VISRSGRAARTKASEMNSRSGSSPPGNRYLTWRADADTIEWFVGSVNGSVQEGKAHIFDIMAKMDPATDPSHPLQRSVDHARASTLTNLVIP
jgi:hypothetical protein